MTSRAGMWRGLHGRPISTMRATSSISLRAHSTNNDPGYANAAFDGLLDVAAGTSDAGRRRELLENE